MGWYVTRKHYFNEGAAYKDRSLIPQRGGAAVDYAMALYGTDSAKK